ncbi:MAG: prepilin-type N-terminal cleavage/methylation domain-containing protein [Ectothiorhodospiraceae bacterium]|jgi:MSHA pilin protein MshD
MCTSSLRRTHRGFTLIELIIAIVVIAAGLAGIFAAVINATARSADPMIQTQAVILARSYLEEIMLRPYSDPQLPDNESTGCPAARDQWDDVSDYDCLSAATVRDQRGNPLAGLGDYRVSVDVSDQSLGGRPAKRIQVEIGHSSADIHVRLVGYRTDY